VLHGPSYLVAIFRKIKLIASGRKNLVIISMKFMGYEIWMPNFRDISIIKFKLFLHSFENTSGSCKTSHKNTTKRDI
jgi:hypothetical protein